MGAQTQAAGIKLGAGGVLASVFADPVPGGGSRTETRLEQPMFSMSARVANGHVQFVSALSLDRLTTNDGVLSLGGWGGGYYDRQHPHEYVHEAVVSLVGDVGDPRAPGRISLSGGRGVVPFGTDPPMSRAPLSVPVNHHWSQVMEHWFGAIGFRRGPVGLELSLFDGRESHGGSGADSADHGSGCTGLVCYPKSSGQSSAFRVTVSPARTVEIRASVATVRAPGHHPGAGNGTQQMLNVSATVDRPIGTGHGTALVEWGSVRAERTYGTALAEAQWMRGRGRFYYRIERTDRPEGPRAANPFRSAPDTVGAAPAGMTRWFVQTVGAGFAFRSRVMLIEPLLEISGGRANSAGDPMVDLDALYGHRTFWSAVAGIRMGLGAPHSMGRYGALANDHDHTGHER